MERTNVRDLSPAAFGDQGFAIVTADLAFVSLRTVASVLVGLAAPGADLVVLVKPQFEAGRKEVGQGGVVSDPSVWRRVVSEVASACREEGLRPVDVMASPLLGPAGNVEFLLHAVLRSAVARKQPLNDRDEFGAAVDGDEFGAAIDRAVEEGSRLVGADE